MTEIAPCPMPGCGGYCEPLRCGPPPGLGWYIKCFNCGHNSGQRHSVDNAIIDHNALCADVALARNLRKAYASIRYVELGQNRSNTKAIARINVFDPIEGDTLDAALAELAKKIEEPT